MIISRAEGSMLKAGFSFVSEYIVRTNEVPLFSTVICSFFCTR